MATAAAWTIAKITEERAAARRWRGLGGMSEKERQYCLFMDGRKHNRNLGCRRHDNAYGINGGGREGDRLAADLALYRHMRDHRDPMRFSVLYFTRVCGWFFFNYHGVPWHGQLVRKIFRNY